MSLNTAVSGWGVISNMDKLYISLPFLSQIYLGMTLGDFNENLKCYSKMKLEPMQDRHKVNYCNSDGTIMLKVGICGMHIHRIEYPGLFELIPNQFKYGCNDKAYLTNLRIDGYMAYFMDRDTLLLKEVTNIPALDISSKELGIDVRSTRGNMRKMAQQNDRAWRNVVNTKNVYSADVYRMQESKVAELEGRLKSLIEEQNKVSKRISKQTKLLKQYKQRLSDAINREEQEKSEYRDTNNAYNSLISRYADEIEELIQKGKIIRASDGSMILGREKSGRVYKEELVPVYDNLGRPMDEVTGKLGAPVELYRGFKPKMVSTLVIDEDYIRAKELLDKLKDYSEGSIEAKKSYDNAVKARSGAERELNSQKNMTWWKDIESGINSDTEKLHQLRAQIEHIKSILYGRK